MRQKDCHKSEDTFQASLGYEVRCCLTPTPTKQQLKPCLLGSLRRCPVCFGPFGLKVNADMRSVERNFERTEMYARVGTVNTGELLR